MRPGLEWGLGHRPGPVGIQGIAFVAVNRLGVAVAVVLERRYTASHDLDTSKSIERRGTVKKRGWTEPGTALYGCCGYPPA